MSRSSVWEDNRVLYYGANAAHCVRYLCFTLPWLFFKQCWVMPVGVLIQAVCHHVWRLLVVAPLLWLQARLGSTNCS